MTSTLGSPYCILLSVNLIVSGPFLLYKKFSMRGEQAVLPRDFRGCGTLLSSSSRIQDSLPMLMVVDTEWLSLASASPGAFGHRLFKAYTGSTQSRAASVCICESSRWLSRQSSGAMGTLPLRDFHGARRTPAHQVLSTTLLQIAIFTKRPHETFTSYFVI